MKATVLYGCKIGQPDYMEEVITEHEDRIEAARKWAENNGYDRLRVATIDLGTPPDFKKTINRKKH